VPTVDATYLAALALTLAIECPLVWLAYRGRPVTRVLVTALAANLFTHRLLWALWPSLPGSYAPRLVAAELVVWLVEAAAYGAVLRGRPARALAVSGGANLASTLCGLALWSLLDR
jgi:hypothetical protein